MSCRRNPFFLGGGEPHLRLDLLLDQPIDPAAIRLLRDADGIFDRLSRRAAVADDADAVDSEEGCSAIFGVIDLFSEAGKSRLEKKVAELCKGRSQDLFFEKLGDRVREPFGDLQRDVPDETV